MANRWNVQTKCKCQPVKLESKGGLKILKKGLIKENTKGEEQQIRKYFTMILKYNDSPKRI